MALAVAASLIALTACGGGSGLSGTLAAGRHGPGANPRSSTAAPVTTLAESTTSQPSSPTFVSPPASTSTVASVPPARYSPAMAYDAKDGEVVMFGGATWDTTCGCNDFMGDTWLWNGTTWKQAAPAQSPPARAYAQMAYDPADGQIVLFGGMEPSGYVSDTWTWNGSDWTARSPSFSPPATIEEGMAYFPSTKSVLLYSGNGAQANGLFSWNGSNWSKITVPGIPPKSSSDAALAMDPDGSAMNVLIFDFDDQVHLHDWTFNGSAWTHLTVATPPARSLVQMVRDTKAGDLVMYGGTGQNDTWVSTGGKWTQVHPVHSPPVLSWDGPMPGMAYDGATGEVVLFGGANQSDVAKNTTWTWNGSDWTQR